MMVHRTVIITIITVESFPDVELFCVVGISFSVVLFSCGSESIQQQ